MAIRYVELGMSSSTYNPSTRLSTGGTSTVYPSIAAGIPNTFAGDTLYIRSGTYLETLSSLSITFQSGSSWDDAPVIAGYPGDVTPVIRKGGGSNFRIVLFVGSSFQYVIWKDLIIDGSELSTSITGASGVCVLFESGPQRVRLENIEVRNSPSSGIFGNDGSQFCEFIDLHVHHNGLAMSNLGYTPGTNGIYWEGSNSLFKGGEYNDNTATGIRTFDSGDPLVNEGNDNIIDGVYAHHNGPGVAFGGIPLANGNGAGVVIGDRRNTIKNCLLVHNRNNGAYVFGGQDHKVYSNTCYGNVTGINLDSSPVNVSIRNNISFGNSGSAIALGTSTGTIQSNNLTTDPLFVDVNSNNYRVRSSSPAINAGIALVDVVTDIDGRVRDNPPDIGAYEFVLTYYVNINTGSNSNNGLSPSTAFRDIQTAIPLAVPGTTILVADGTYGPPSVTNLVAILGGSGHRSGTAALPIILKSENKHGAKLIARSLNDNVNRGVFFSNVQWWIIDGLDISGANGEGGTGASNAGFHFEGSGVRNIVLRNCAIHHIGRLACTESSNGNSGGLLQDCINCTIENNVFYSNGRLRAGESGCALNPSTQHDHGLYIKGSSGTIIRGNVFYDTNRGWPLHFFGGTVVNALVEHNTFADKAPNPPNHPPGHILIGSTINGLIIRNNIFYDVILGVFRQFALNATGIVITHNLTNSNDADWFDTAMGAGITLDATNIKNVDPLFVDAPNRNYRLLPGSPAIGTALDVGYGVDRGAIQTIGQLGATYYIAENGSDSNNGLSTSTPKRTFSPVVSLLQPGDTVLIRGGVYDDHFRSMLGRSGTQAFPITIAAYPNESVTIRPLNGLRIIDTNTLTNHWVFRDMIWDGEFSQEGTLYTNQVQGACTGFTFERIEVRNWITTFAIFNGNNVAVRQCKLHHQRTNNCSSTSITYGLRVHQGNNVLVEECDVYNNPGGGLFCYPGPVSGLIFRRNKIRNNASCENSTVGGLFVATASSAGGGGPVTGVELYNNLIYDNKGSLTHGTAGIRIGTGMVGVKVWNNTIYGHFYGVNVQTGSLGGPQDTDIRNNLLFGASVEAIPDAGTGTVKLNNMTTDPGFIDLVQRDFHLRVTSLAIDGGVAIAQITVDLDGVARVGLPDIGCYERAGGQVFRVTVNGNDLNSGSISSPWRTIQKAVTSMLAGDTAIVGDGVYTDTDNDGKVVSITGAVLSGNATAPITLISENLYGAKISLPSLHTDPVPYRNVGIYINKAFWVIDGFEIFGGTGIATQNGYAGIHVQGTVASDVKIQNCRVKDIGVNICTGSPMIFAGILAQQAVRVMIEKCIVFNIGRRRFGENGCALTPGGVGVTNNDHGIVLDNCSSPTVKRNILYDVTKGYGVFIQSSTALPSTSVKIFNNVFADGVLSGVPRSHVWLGGGIQGAEIKNNISFNALISMIQYGASPAFSLIDVNYNVCSMAIVDGSLPAGLTVGANNKANTNPLFSDAPNRIYTLSLGSPAIDAGVNVNDPFSGLAPDAGAIEGVDTIAPAAPTGLIVT